ncbi:hypothetical protein MLD38_002277 [Melastoma candidum]|uniref:Uncharacterized protein n=1 Tax=Melastoma candidum TaxID=119954 RepID=A0ACB9SG11_9MYRT|nr:hypothetical protein MLD38_002277 [Melastoma candidum]
MGGLPLENGSSALAFSGPQQKQLQENLTSAGTGTGTGTGTASKPKKKICCACPDTKKLRDECIVQHGEDACAKWINAHRQCLRAEGFNV